MTQETKEPFETFGWMSESDKFFFEDVRRALDETPGSREYLKNNEVRQCMPFHIVLSERHSGASHYSILRSYKHALENWDEWVFRQKVSMVKTKEAKEEVKKANERAPNTI
jgi:hypothetical protein